MDITTTRTPEKAAQIERFVQLYERNQSDVMLRIERRVCGCDYGGTSWSTRAEADRLRQLLALGRDRHLLEVDAGAGWPGLYLAKTSQCEVTLTDLHPGSLHIASGRVARDWVEGESGMHHFAVAEGGALPFATGTFDAIVHSDVLCCLQDKAAVLNACRGVIRKDGRMAFTVILTAPGLKGDDLAQAIAAGPTYITTDTEYPEMVGQGGLGN
ncbi:MAG: class I SAM-dependent methyltransferase [Alphaproteobacteria bacterium]